MRRITGPVTALLLAASLLSVGGSSVVLAADPAADPIAAFAAVGSPAFTPNGDGIADTFAAHLTTAAQALVTVDVVNWEGEVVATLLPPGDLPAGELDLSWDGAGAPDGPYRVRAIATSAATGAQSVRQIDIARVSALPYPVNPSAVVVFLDPGHGGAGTGGTSARLPDGTLIREADLNLEIALKLSAMLRAAGIRVSLSRTADVPANASRTDRNGDRKADQIDDWLARMDAANRARADLYVAIHNNEIPGGGGRTEAFFCGVGCTAPASSRALAGDVLQAHAAAFAPYETPSWHVTLGSQSIPAAKRNPTDDTIRFAYATWPPGRHFYYLGPYAAPYRPRSLQMPAMLMESLALSDPTELAMLATPSIRTVIANAYFDGITRWLGERGWGLRLDPVSAPLTARVGRQSVAEVRLTNNGNVPLLKGTPIVIGSVKPVAVYDGSPFGGAKIGGVRTSGDLAPGASVVLRIPVRPTTAGAAIWKVDAVVGGVRTSAQRVPFLQWRVTVTR